MAENLTVRHSLKPLVGCGIFLEIVFLSLYLLPAGGISIIGFILVHSIAFIILAILWWQKERFLPSQSSASILLIVGFGVLFRLSLVPHMPICSDDIYRYVWDGKVVLHGLNPYAFAPSDPQLASLATPTLPGRVNHPTLGTVYPPLAQMFFAFAFFIVGESVVGFKLLLVLVDAGTSILLITLLRRWGKSVEAIILYAWSPLPILYGALDGHLDVLGIPFLMLLLYWAAKRRYVLSAVSTAGAALIKLHPIVLAPLFVRARPWPRGLGIAVMSVAIFLAAYLPFASHINDELRWLSQFGVNWEFNGSIFSIVFALVQDNQKAHAVMNVLLVVWVGWLSIRNASFNENVFLALLGLVIFSPLVHPWYLLWLAAMMVMRWSPSVFLFLGLSVLSNIVVYRYSTHGEWIDDPLVVALQYVPFAFAMLWEWKSRRMLARH